MEPDDDENMTSLSGFFKLTKKRFNITEKNFWATLASIDKKMIHDDEKLSVRECVL